MALCSGAALCCEDMCPPRPAHVAIKASINAGVLTVAIAAASLASAAEPALDAAAEGSRDTESSTETAEPATPHLLDRFTATAFWFWADGKVMPGLELSGGKDWFQLDIELAFVALSKSSPDFDGTFLGNQLGIFAMFTPLRDRYYEVSAGIGADFYLLWGIQSEVVERALAPRLSARIWPLEHVAVTLTARAYPVHTSGLDLGTRRDGSDGSPLLITSGITWGFL